MVRIRKPAVAGQFYPAEANRLRRTVADLLSTATEITGPAPKAIIAPHAGYSFSGPIAGTAYAHLARANGSVRRVILMGPSHFVPVPGLAASSAEAFATPLGSIPQDKEMLELILPLRQVRVSDYAHAEEHCLEVQLPFIQMILDEFSLVPLAVGDADPADVADILDLLWGGSETVIVISSDLSHYHNHETARKLDQKTAEMIENLKPLAEEQACGRRAINGLLYQAHRRGMQVKTVDLRNSGDTAGSRDRVVGYGAFLFTESV